jgi:hypothetical protein
MNGRPPRTVAARWLFRRRAALVESSWLLPAVPESGVDFDPVEGWVAGAKLVADALDGGSYIRPIAVVVGSLPRGRLPYYLPHESEAYLGQVMPRLPDAY